LKRTVVVNPAAAHVDWALTAFTFVRSGTVQFGLGVGEGEADAAGEAEGDAEAAGEGDGESSGVGLGDGLGSVAATGIPAITHRGSETRLTS
jgi:hypothetical protein